MMTLLFYFIFMHVYIMCFDILSTPVAYIVDMYATATIAVFMNTYTDVNIICCMCRVLECVRIFHFVRHVYFYRDGYTDPPGHGAHQSSGRPGEDTGQRDMWTR
jgi:hypothetical protein